MSIARVIPRLLNSKLDPENVVNLIPLLLDLLFYFLELCFILDLPLHGGLYD